MTISEHASNAGFEIDAWNEVAYDEPGEGPKLTRITISGRATEASQGVLTLVYSIT